MTPRWYWLLLISIYFIIATILYSPSFNGPWQYDDYAQILDTKVLTARSVSTLLASVFRFTAWPDGWTGTRDFVRASFRLNWDWWGQNPMGYRWVNLGIHVMTAWLVSLLIYNLCNSYNRYNHSVFVLSALSGLLFLIHPIQSQAVAYIAQRFASTATMFYVATIVFFLLYMRHNDYKGYKRYIFYSFSLLSALFALNSKEIAMTLPVALVLVVIVYSSQQAARGKLQQVIGSQLSAVRYKLIVLSLSFLPFFLLALKVPLQVMTASARGGVAEGVPVPTKLEFGALAVQQEKSLLSRQEYFLTELNVMRTYLRLLILPIGQTLDWDYPITRTLDLPTGLSGLLHIALIGGGVWLLLQEKRGEGRRKKEENRMSAVQDSFYLLPFTFYLRLVGVGILWFYLTIALESSVVPIPDVLYEHRVYLPFVGVVIAVAGVAAIGYESYRSYRTYMAAATALWLLLLSIGTLRRAYVWGDEVRLWADVYQKSPNKPRANKNYGVVLAARGQYQQGIVRLKRAIELESDNADYWSNLGTAYLRSGDFQNSAPPFLKAFELATEKSQKTGRVLGKTEAQYINDYGVSLVQLGNGKEAAEAFETALRVDSTLYAAWLGLGAAKNVIGDTEGAISVFGDLVKRYPDQSDAYGNLATMYIKAKQYDEALTTFVSLKKLNPRYEGLDDRIALLQKVSMDKKYLFDTMNTEGSNR